MAENKGSAKNLLYYISLAVAPFLCIVPLIVSEQLYSTAVRYFSKISLIALAFFVDFLAFIILVGLFMLLCLWGTPRLKSAPLVVISAVGTFLWVFFSLVLIFSWVATDIRMVFPREVERFFFAGRYGMLMPAAATALYGILLVRCIMAKVRAAKVVPASGPVAQVPAAPVAAAPQSQWGNTPSVAGAPYTGSGYQPGNASASTPAQPPQAYPQQQPPFPANPYNTENPHL